MMQIAGARPASTSARARGASGSRSDEGVEQVADPAAVLGRDRVDVADPQAREVLGRGLRRPVVALVGHEHQRAPGAAQALGDLEVAGRGRGLHVDDEQHEVGLLDPPHRLRGDLPAHVAGVGLVDAAGVDELEGAAVPLGARLAPVAGDPRLGVDRRPRAGRRGG